MDNLRKLVVAAAIGVAMSAIAQTPTTTPSEWAARMDQQMTAMRSLHEQMANAKTPQERDALMAGHRALMQSGMQMMGGMGPGAGARGMAGMAPGMGAGMGPGGAGSGAMRDNADPPADWAARQQWMEKRMEMMQSMLQLMVDRLPPEPARK
jgi:hypothetical protein